VSIASEEDGAAQRLGALLGARYAPARGLTKASIFKNGRVVFNIKGDSYRLVCQINYSAGTIEIRVFGSHADYDTINAETV